MADTNTEQQDVGPFMLTTVDNPYDPFTEWDEWYAFDVASGYNSCSFLARITPTSDELSDLDQDQAIQMGIDEIVRENVSGMHRKVSRESMKSLKER